MTSQDLAAAAAGDLGTAARPARHRAEGWAWFLAGGLLSAALTWPLLAHLRDRVPQDGADPLTEAWEVAWSGHALMTQPLHLFRANAFWPEGPSLAFSDSQMGYLPASLIGHGATAAVVRYNLLFLFAYALAFAGAALLAREFGVGIPAASIAGVAYAWAPWRIAQNGHLNILSIGGVAMSLFLLASGYRRGRPWQVVAGWLVAAWQVTLGFALGIWFCYLLAVIVVVVAVGWLRRGRPAPAAGVLRATVLGAGVFGLVAVAMAIPYVEVLHNYPDAPRTRAELAFYSPPARGLLAASAENRFWGARTVFVRKTLPWPPEQTLFPGLTVLFLAVAGLRWKGASTRMRVGLATSTVVGVVLCLGLRLHDGTFTYGPLYDHLPAWKGMRTPGRLAFVWTLGLAVLAAMGGERIRAATRSRVVVAGSMRVPVGVATALTTLLAGLVLYEGTPRLPLAAVPAVPAGLADIAGPIVQFPADAFHDNAYVFWSTEGFTKMANGNTSYLPPSLAAVREMKGFPDLASVQALRSRGYRSVVVHLDLIAGTPWQDVEQRPLDGLGVTSRADKTLLVFDLRS